MTPSPSPHRPTAAPLLAAALLAALLAVGLLAAACSTPSPEVEGEVADGEAAPAPVSPAERPAAPADRPPPGDLPTACTQIGCADGLNVELDGFDEEVELELTAGEETRTVTCLPPGPCHHFIPDFTPAEVTATAFLADGTEEERPFTPEYREERPNGPDCPPICRQAAIRWKL